MKPLIAYAVVKKKNPALKFLDLYPDKDIQIGKDEKVIKVVIQEQK